MQLVRYTTIKLFLPRVNELPEKMGQNLNSEATFKVLQIGHRIHQFQLGSVMEYNAFSASLFAQAPYAPRVRSIVGLVCAKYRPYAARLRSKLARRPGR